MQGVLELQDILFQRLRMSPLLYTQCPQPPMHIRDKAPVRILLEVSAKKLFGFFTKCCFLLRMIVGILAECQRQSAPRLHESASFRAGVVRIRLQEFVKPRTSD